MLHVAGHHRTGGHARSTGDVHGLKSTVSLPEVLTVQAVCLIFPVVCISLSRGKVRIRGFMDMWTQDGKSCSIEEDEMLRRRRNGCVV